MKGEVPDRNAKGWKSGRKEEARQMERMQEAEGTSGGQRLHGAKIVVTHRRKEDVERQRSVAQGVRRFSQRAQGHAKGEHSQLLVEE